jgi:hypothetical protein
VSFFFTSSSPSQINSSQVDIPITKAVNVCLILLFANALVCRIISCVVQLFSCSECLIPCYLLSCRISEPVYVL